MSLNSYVFRDLSKDGSSITNMPDNSVLFARCDISLELHLRDFGFVLTLAVAWISINEDYGY
jgi:hypothetical protein